MDFVNNAATAIFDALMPIFGVGGPTFALILISGVFGILALICFKFISWQGGIKSTKDKIKGGLIEIRLYSDDLAIVVAAVGKVLGRNIQYLTLNFAPIAPLLIPFTLIAAQLVVRFGFTPIPVWDETRGEPLAGQGTTIEIALREGEERKVSELEVELPANLRQVSDLVRVPSEGKAYVEVVAIADGAEQIVLRLPGEELTKEIVTGDVEIPATMQPERVGSFFASWLWPAEPTTAGTSFDRVAFLYPERTLPGLGWLPGGPFGVLTVFLIASMLFGVVILKPLGIQI